MDDRFKRQAEELVSRLTLDEKLAMLTTHHAAAERLGLKEFYIGTEVARGFVGREPESVSTVFPQPVGLASTFDTDLMEKLGEIAANEARAYYNAEGKSCLCLWGPTVDPVRDPRWGRTEEAYGEDVFLAGEMSRAYTIGMAGEKDGFYKTVPTLKHFCANNNEEDRGRDDSVFPLRQKYEYYYAPFANAIANGGARSVMASYNKVNGVPSVCNTDLQGYLKDKLGLWFVVSDGGGFSQIYSSHRYTESHSETFAEAIKAGCDSMTDNDEIVKNAAKRALKAGIITEAEIDRSLCNTIYARIRLGQLEDHDPFGDISKDVIDCAEYKEINKRAALEQVCLLKNDGLLPIKTKPKTIAVVGALADENIMDWYTGHSSGDISVLEGFKREFPDSKVVHDSLWDIVSVKTSSGKYLSAKENGDILADADEAGESELFELQSWGENWNCLFSVKYKSYVRLTDGRLKLHNRVIHDWFTYETFNLFPALKSGKTLIEEFMRHKRLVPSADGSVVTTELKCETDEALFEINTVSKGKDRAAELAKQNDLVVYCVGNHPLQTAKECYDRKTIALNVQPGIAEAAAENNKNTVMAVISSYPYAITAENEKLPAILYSSHAGAFLGTAIAETVSGKNNPSAKLPLTWYASDNDLHDIKEYDIEKNQATYMYFKGKPLYPFGHGLSYSAFEYQSISAQRHKDYTIIKAKIKNVSDIDGTETVQIYYNLKESAVKRPPVKLCGFTKVFIAANETMTVEIKIPDYALEIYDVRSGRMIVESGEYHFFAAQDCKNLKAECSADILGESIAQRPSEFEAQSFEGAENIRICYSKKLHAHYIKVVGWSGSVYYGGIDLKGKSRIALSAAASINPSNFTVTFDKASVSFTVEPSDSSDDFCEYFADIPKEAENAHGFTVTMGEASGLLKIAVE